MTSPFDAAVTAAQTAQQAGAVLAQENTSLTAQHAADQTTIAAQAAQIAELEAELHPAPATLFGANTSTPANFPAVAKLLAPVGVWRYYLQPGERPHPPTELPIAADTKVVASLKLPPAEVPSGRWDEDILALMRGVWAVCGYHEPRDNVEAGQFTIAQYQAMYDHLIGLARQTDVKLVPILMRATYAGIHGCNPRDYLPSEYDFAGVDAYVAGGIGVGVTEIGSLLDPVRAAAPGKPIVVGETGVGRKVTGPARADALTKLAAYFRGAGDVAAVCYFLGNSPDKIEWSLTPAEAGAWRAGQTG